MLVMMMGLLWEMGVSGVTRACQALSSPEKEEQEMLVMNVICINMHNTM